MTTETAPSSDTPSLSPRAWFWIGFAGLYVLALVAFAPAMGAWFIWDDNHYVSENPAMTRGLEGLRQIWLDVSEPDTYPAPQYYPMTFTSLWIEYQLWGVNATPYHITNILLHATAAMLLWIILRKLNVPGAWVVAAIFAVHPVQVESVAWITERKNTLSAVFYFLSMLVYLRFCGLDATPEPAAGVLQADDAPSPRDNPFVLPAEPWKVYALSLVLFACALFSKTVTGSLPAVMLLVLWWKHGRLSLKKDVVPLLPFVALAVLMGRITAWYEVEKVGAQGPDFAFDWSQRVLIAGRALWFYAGKLFAPFNLTFIYPKFSIDPKNVALLAFPALAALVPIVLFLLRNRIGRGPVVAVLIFGGTLVPALGFFNVFPMRYSYVADHFQYLAMIGLVLLAVGAMHLLIRSSEARIGIATVVIVVLGALSIRQCRVYADIKTLWDHVLEQNPDSWMAHNNLGSWYYYQATQNSSSAKEQSDNFNKAIEHYQNARRLRKADLGTDHMEAVMSIGVVAERIGNLPYAQKRYEEAIALIPAEGKRFPYYAEPYFHLAVVLAMQGRTDDAIATYNKSLELNPRHVLALNNLGNIRFEQGQLEEAIDLLSRAVEQAPDFAGAHLNLGNVLFRAGKNVEAVEQWKEAQKLAPNDEKPIIQMASFLAGYGRFDEAENAFRRALQLNPRSIPARTNLGIILIQKGKPAEAIEQLDLVLKMDPNNEIAIKQRATATTMPSTLPATAPLVP